MKENSKTPSKMEIPKGLWLRCDGCGEILYRKSLEQNLFVCMRCGYHFRISATKYVELILDNESFEEFDKNFVSGNPLNFPNYKEKLEEAQKKTGYKEAFIYGRGRINNIAVIFGAMDFNFMGGSMGSVVGEKVARAIRKAYTDRVPLIIVATSGGARMQEGIFSLMQLAKTAAELALLASAKIPYIVVVTNPTMAGVMASYASLGDIIIAEPKALLGFAGARVIEGTIGEKLPEGFQTAEFLLAHGFVDLVVPRKQLRPTISKILDIVWNKKESQSLETEKLNYKIEE
ncbi:MAG: acetyl-CoA carboxylase, carboxyltransferase subunit beta [candidate division WOR-3 bacterium]|nr:acetyl-CoA carboxylase, carboxyltransferase subunit beta [candidate division WOR-3 bacterium]MCX7756860.1 acetyl-CoA carboxylase, carboxyltransferase subunit beta [candidate division WOR-3 bacterium]MDW7987632.1 acetyl-CoA carboxylase, carboxyltransferase subunit beta [candidate division WOR-3 bacterium]